MDFKKKLSKLSDYQLYEIIAIERKRLTKIL
jgi:hypothetical protein